MTYLILITAVAVSMILHTFEWFTRVFNFKPFSCPSCLSAWVALGLLLTFAQSHWWAFPSAYLLTAIYLKYERT